MPATATGPPENDGAAPHHQDRDQHRRSQTNKRQCSGIAAWKRRQAAARRLVPLDCGCRDPWTCRCHDGPPHEKMADGYRDAVLHLGAHGLLAAPHIPEMRVLWKRGGDDRALVREIAEQWGLVA